MPPRRRSPVIPPARAASGASHVAIGAVLLGTAAALASACTLTTSLDDYAGPPLGADDGGTADVGTPVEAAADAAPGTDAGVDAATRASLYREAVLLDAPLAYYRFDESGPVVHDERGAADGTFVSGDGRVTGLFPDEQPDDQAGAFTGSSYVDLGDRFGFAGNASYTIELWVSPLAPNGSSMCLAAKTAENDAGTVGDGWGVYLGGSNDTIASRWRASDQKTSTASRLPTARWSHVVTTFDGVRQRVYIGGQLTADEPASGGLSTTPSATTLGAGRNGKACFFRGALDEVAIYDHVLTDARVAAHFEAGKPAP